ncbi:agmatine deiminase family protein [Leisingera caerulea]|uniref:Agmatine deiminase family protein n=1 Tax=Leisingera caerulea TaxID=506591 RepID=A0A9Q9HI20_LEICA|nr:agmatine deiminase family protein [Leisingera caerulea]UWQ54746.1 agmatine deiminase family protein [Leisingera caerulea]
MPPVDGKPDGSRRFLSYVNFYLVNGGVIGRQYGLPKHDQEALDVLARLFPEAARRMVPQGAGRLLCPTAIGSEPARPGYPIALAPQSRSACGPSAFMSAAAARKGPMWPFPGA